MLEHQPKVLLLATTNPGKLAEFKIALKPLVDKGVTLKSLADVGLAQDVEETGTNFKENALLKAKHYAHLSNLPTIADDGGFVISALNGEPGVKSHRWLGRDATDEELIQYTLQKTAHLPVENRQAALELVLCFYDPKNGTTLYETAKIEGSIALSPTNRRIKGFPYRALLKVKPYDKFYDELTIDEHQATNHRLRAFRNLMPLLTKYYE